MRGYYQSWMISANGNAKAIKQTFIEKGKVISSIDTLTKTAFKNSDRFLEMKKAKTIVKVSEVGKKILWKEVIGILGLRLSGMWKL